jgi:hypothetical protein
MDATSLTTQVDPVWGPLARPLHQHVPYGDGVAAWKDNAYIAFWDLAQRTFGSLHVSTSPNAEGRRARMSLSVDGRSVEVIEELPPGSFQSRSIDFRLDGRIRVEHPRVSLRLESQPRLALADYCAGQVIPPMNGAPVEHYQQAIDLSGSCTLDGREVALAATGIRDRTWGYRDESVNIAEYFWFFGAFPGFAITAMRFFAEDVAERTDGFVLRESTTESVTSIGVVRDASGLCAEAIFGLESGEELRMRSQGREAGFWLPMGWERRGPAMSAYDEFCPFVLADGTAGYGVAQHGNVRQLF